MGKFRSLNSPRRVASQLNLPVSVVERCMPFVSAHTTENGYSQTAALDSLLSYASPEPRALTLATMSETPTTVEQTRCTIIDILRKGHPEYRDIHPDKVLSAKVIRGYLKQKPGRIGPDLLAEGLVQMSVPEPGAVPTYSITGFARRLVIPLIWSVANFVYLSRANENPPQYDSMARLFVRARDNSVVYQVTKEVVKNGPLSKRQLVSAIRGVRPEVSMPRIHHIVDTLADAGILGFASVDRTANEPLKRVLHYTRLETSASKEDIANRARSRAKHKNPLIYYLDAIDYVNSHLNEPYTIDGFANFFKAKYHFGYSNARRLATEVLIQLSDVGFLSRARGIAAKQKSNIWALEHGHRFYELILEPGAHLACTLSAARVPQAVRSEQRLSVLFKNYLEETQQSYGRRPPDAQALSRREESTIMGVDTLKQNSTSIKV